MKQLSQQQAGTLLDRYMDGLTTLEEEAALRGYFSTHDDIPDEWQDYTDRIALVDGSAAASPFPSTARVVTAGGTDVTEKAHFAVRNGIASICFAQGTMVIFR